jgi:hypothetical protein
MPDDEPLAEEEIEDPGEEGFDPMEAAQDYLQGRTLEEKQAIWDALTPQEQSQVQAFGVAGPVTVSEDDDFEPVPVEDRYHRSVLQMAKSEVERAVKLASVGQSSLSPELAEQIVAMKREADIYPDGPERSQFIQRAAHLVRKAENEARESIPFNKHALGVNRQEEVLPDGRVQVTYRHMGRSLVEVWDPDELAEQHPEMFAPVETKLYADPAKVTAKQLLSWSERDQIRFMKDHPKESDRLLAQASLMADAEETLRRGSR